MTKILEWEDKVLSKYFQKYGVDALSRETVRHITDWFESDEGQSYHSSILRVSVPQALNLSKRWIEALSKKGVKEEKGDSIPVLFCEQGFTWVEILKKNGLVREGSLMRHCVGSRGYDRGVKDKTTRIFSLRDASNFPHATVELKPNTYTCELFAGNTGNRIKVVKNAGVHRFIQMNGRANSKLAERYVPYFKDFLNFSLKNYQLKVDDFDFFPKYHLIKHNGEMEFSKNLNTISANVVMNGQDMLSDTEVVIEGNLKVRAPSKLPAKLKVLKDFYLYSEIINPEAEVEVEGTFYCQDPEFKVPSHWKVGKIEKGKRLESEIYLRFGDFDPSNNFQALSRIFRDTGRREEILPGIRHNFQPAFIGDIHLPVEQPLFLFEQVPMMDEQILRFLDRARENYEGRSITWSVTKNRGKDISFEEAFNSDDKIKPIVGSEFYKKIKPNSLFLSLYTFDPKTAPVIVIDSLCSLEEAFIDSRKEEVEEKPIQKKKKSVNPLHMKPYEKRKFQRGF